MNLKNDIELMIRDITEDYINDPKKNLTTTNMIGVKKYIDAAVQQAINHFVKMGNEESIVTSIAFKVGEELKATYESKN